MNTQNTHSHNPIFLRGKKVNLRPFSERDIPLLTRWINDPEVREFLSSVTPKSERQEQEWIQRLGNDDKEIVLCIETHDGQAIGSMGLHRIDWVDRRCVTGAFIGEKAFLGQGYGTDAKMYLLQHAFQTLNLHRVCSSVFGFNERSLRYSLHCGYKVEGRRREHVFRHGKYWDLIELGLLREEWLPFWEAYQRDGHLPSLYVKAQPEQTAA